ncbi:MAG: hypothetical protein Q7T57_03890 [Dehalococcoidales bacterium]|nr:hypothetical protein [Dehalococcoidales bacterium]
MAEVSLSSTRFLLYSLPTIVSLRLTDSMQPPPVTHLTSMLQPSTMPLPLLVRLTSDDRWRYEWTNEGQSMQVEW